MEPWQDDLAVIVQVRELLSGVRGSPAPAIADTASLVVDILDALTLNFPESATAVG